MFLQLLFYLLIIILNLNQLIKKITSQYKEIKIKSIVEIPHEHQFVVDKLSGGFVCNKYPFCEEYMSFNITSTVRNEPFKVMLISPIHLVNRILKKLKKIIV